MIVLAKNLLPGDLVIYRAVDLGNVGKVSEFEFIISVVLLGQHVNITSVCYSSNERQMFFRESVNENTEFNVTRPGHDEI